MRDSKHRCALAARGFNLCAALGLAAIASSTGAMAWTGQPLAYATTSNGISVIDTGSNTVVDTIPCCGVAAVSPDGKYVYAFDNILTDTLIKISVIDTTTDKVVAQVPLDISFLANARSLDFDSSVIAVSPDGKYIYAATGYCSSASFGCETPSSVNFAVWAIDTLTRKVVAVREGEDFGLHGAAMGIAFTPDAKHAYVANHETYIAPPPFASVLVFDTGNFSASLIPLPGPDVDGIAMSPDGKHAYLCQQDLNTVSVLDTATSMLRTTIPVGIGPYGVAITPDGTRAYVTNQFSNTVSVIGTASNTVAATVPVGKAPIGVAITPNGKFAYVANQDSSTVSVIETARNIVVATIPNLAGASAIAIVPHPPGVPFSGFTAKLDIDFGAKPNDDSLLFWSHVTLGPGSNGINPPAEAVTLKAGTFSMTIPPGSFTGTGFGPFTFHGVINGVDVQAAIENEGTKRYRLHAHARHANAAGTKYPLLETLIFGDDSGATTLQYNMNGGP